MTPDEIYKYLGYDYVLMKYTDEPGNVDSGIFEVTTCGDGVYTFDCIGSTQPLNLTADQILRLTGVDDPYRPR